MRIVSGTRARVHQGRRRHGERRRRRDERRGFRNRARPAGWLPTPAVEVGDFTALWSELDDVDPDPSHQNDSWQVASIDDGVVVPGTDGTPCITWCYGPDGWVYNLTAGLHGGGVAGGPIGWANSGVWNAVISPPLAWPGGTDAGRLAFDVYAHMQSYECGLTAYGWSVRTTTAADPARLLDAPWEWTRWSCFNQDAMPAGPGYQRIDMSLGDRTLANIRWLQVPAPRGVRRWTVVLGRIRPRQYAAALLRQCRGAGLGHAGATPAGGARSHAHGFTQSIQSARRANLESVASRARGPRGVRCEGAIGPPPGRGSPFGRRGWRVLGRSGRAGRRVAAGIYLARLRTTAGTERCKLTLAR